MHLIEETRPEVIRVRELIEQHGGMQNFVDELVQQTEDDVTPNTVCVLANGLRDIGVGHFCFMRRLVSSPQNYAVRERVS